MRTAIALLLLYSLTLTGCASPEEIRITNDTSYSMYVHLALPYPAYEMLNNHKRYSVRIEPGDSWNTEDATSDDRADLDLLHPNDAALLRLYQYGNAGWSSYALQPAEDLFEVDPVRLRINTDANGEFTIAAEDARGAPVPVTPIDDSVWFARP